MSSPPDTKPRTFEELFDFYYNDVKVLYSYISAQNQLPIEVLFEIHAALDHISRKWQFNESEEAAVDRAYGHLKRSCLDIYKLVTREAARQYTELLNIDLGDIDNGQFDHELRILFAKIRSGATEARRVEGRTSADDSEVPAFALWKAVLVDCLTLQDEYYLSPKVKWTKTKTHMHRANKRVDEVCTGFAIAAAFFLLTSPPDTYRHIALFVLIAALAIRAGVGFYCDRMCPRMFPTGAQIDPVVGPFAN